MKWLCIHSVNDNFRVGKSYSFVNGKFYSDSATYLNHPHHMVSAKFVPMFECYLNQCEQL